MVHGICYTHTFLKLFSGAATFIFAFSAILNGHGALFHLGTEFRHPQFRREFCCLQVIFWIHMVPTKLKCEGLARCSCEAHNTQGATVQFKRNPDTAKSTRSCQSTGSVLQSRQLIICVRPTLQERNSGCCPSLSAALKNGLNKVACSHPSKC